MTRLTAGIGAVRGWIGAAAPGAAALLLACGGDSPAGIGSGADDPTTVPVTLRTVSGDSQVGEVGRLLGEFLVFRVVDPDGRPVAGVRVEWEVVGGGGQVSGKRHETDLEGLAAGNFTLGDEPGEQVARAVVRDSLAIEFVALAVPPGPEEPPR